MALRITTLVGVLALLLGAPLTARANEAAIGQARTVANAWLAQLHDYEYEETWATAGELLKAAVSRDEWSKRMSVTLGPLGKAASSAVRSTEYSTTMPGAPDGEYVVVKFDTSFENKQTALETLALKKESDGLWRVSGYYIK